MPGPYAPIGYRSDVTPDTTGFPGMDSMHTNVREWYSWAVVASVVTAAGLVCNVQNVDVNQVDVTVSTIGTWQGRQRIVSLQVKSSSGFETFAEKGVDCISKSFPRAYYDDMQAPRTLPLFLVLVALPPTTSPWTRVRQGIHAMHAAAWWGQATDPSNGLANQTVRIPASQRLDVAGLQTMLAMA
jgi:hypothetical protein